MRHTLIALALGLTACAAPDPDGFDVDPRLADDFAAAAREWCDAGARCAYQAPDGPSTLRLVKDVHILHGAAGECLARPDGASQIEIDRDDAPETRLNVVAHELGHHFGCKHSDDPADLMWPYVQALITPPTAHDVACAQ